MKIGRKLVFVLKKKKKKRKLANIYFDCLIKNYHKNFNKDI